jgi:hypothetical protein
VSCAIKTVVFGYSYLTFLSLLTSFSLVIYILFQHCIVFYKWSLYWPMKQSLP